MSVQLAYGHADSAISRARVRVAMDGYADGDIAQLKERRGA